MRRRTEDRQLSRRHVLAASAGVASGALAGCTSVLGGGDDDDESLPEYARWNGPSVPGDYTQTFYYLDFSSLQGNGHLHDGMAEMFREQVTRISSGGDETSTGALDPADVQYSIYGNGGGAVVGTFGSETILDLLTENGWTRRDTEETPTLILPGEDTYVAAVVGDGVVVTGYAKGADEAVETARSILAVENGDAKRFAETNEAAGTLVEKLGSGPLAGGIWDIDKPKGVRVALDGADAHWRQVVVAAEEAAADPKPWREMIAKRSEKREGRDIRTLNHQFSVYSDTSVWSEGRAVILEGTLPVAEIRTMELSPAPLNLS